MSDQSNKSPKKVYQKLPPLLDWIENVKEHPNVLSAGYFSHLPTLNWWTHPEDLTPFRGDIDLYIVTDHLTANAVSHFVRLIAEAVEVMDTSKRYTIQGNIIHGPYKPEYTSQHELFLHCFLIDKKGGNITTIFRWSLLTNAVAIYGIPLQKVLSRPHIDRHTLLTEPLGIDDLTATFETGKPSVEIAQPDGTFQSSALDCGPFQFAEFAAYVVEASMRNILRYHGDADADSGRWLVAASRYLCRDTYQQLERLVRLKKHIRHGQIARADLPSRSDLFTTAHECLLALRYAFAHGDL